MMEGEEFRVQSAERGERRAHLQPHNRDPDHDLSLFPQFLIPHS